MDDALVVRGGEPARDLDGAVHRAAYRERTVSEGLTKRLAVEQLHHGVADAVGGADIVNRQDIGMSRLVGVPNADPTLGARLSESQTTSQRIAGMCT